MTNHGNSIKPLYGGIEGGGTKFVCAVGNGTVDLRAEIRFPTTTPKETLGRAIEFARNLGAAGAKNNPADDTGIRVAQ